MLPPISKPGISSDLVAQEPPMHRIFSIPEMRRAIGNRLDEQYRYAFFDALTTPTRKSESLDPCALNYRALKLHLVEAKVLPEDQRELFRAKESPPQVLLLDELKALAASNELGKIAKNTTLLNCLIQFGNPDTFKYLEQQIKQNQELKEALLDLVKSSQTEAEQAMVARASIKLNKPIEQKPQGEPSVAAERSIPAAGILTLLAKADVNLSGQDFSGIEVPGADLSGGKLNRAKFIGADLSNVDFQGAQLRGVNLQDANLAGVNFGELPSLALGESLSDIKSNSILCYSSESGCLGIKKPDGNEINFYNPGTSELVSKYKLPNLNRAYDLEIFPGNKIIGVWEAGGGLSLWKIEGMERLHTFGRLEKYTRVCTSPNGKTLAAVNIYGEVDLWSVESGEVLDTFSKSDTSYDIGAIDFSPDGRFLAIGEKAIEGMGKLKLWDLENKTMPYEFTESDVGYFSHLRFSPDGKNIVSWNTDGPATLWSVSGRKKLYTLTDRDVSGGPVVFSPDGNFLVKAGYRKLGIWNVDNGQKIHTLEIEGFLGNLCFSPDGKILAVYNMAYKIGGKEKINLWKVNESSLYRNSYRKELDATGMRIQGAQGLTLMNESWLKQRGAYGEPAPQNDNEASD